MYKNVTLLVVLAGLSLVVSAVLFSAHDIRAEEPGGAGEPAVTHKPKVFHRLWKVYPNKEGKEAAIEAWNALQISDEDLDRMRAAYPRWKFSSEWAREKGKYVPPLAKWLNERIWEQEPPPPAPSPPLRVSEVSTFLVQPIYLGPRLAFAVSGAIVGGILYPFDQTSAKKVWTTSWEAPWIWHELIDPQD